MLVGLLSLKADSIPTYPPAEEVSVWAAPQGCSSLPLQLPLRPSDPALPRGHVLHPHGICRLCPQLLTAWAQPVQPETNSWLISKPCLTSQKEGYLLISVFSAHLFLLDGPGSGISTN